MNLYMLATLLGEDLDYVRDYGCESCGLCGLNGNQHTHDCPVPSLVQVRRRMVPMVTNAADGRG